MKAGTLAVLAGAAVVVGGAAWIAAGRDPEGPAAKVAGVGGPLFPALQGKDVSVGSVAVRSGSRTVTVALKDGVWGIAEKGGYPAKEDAVRSAVRALAGLKVVEAKTSRPEMYAKIGVQDPADVPAEAAEGDSAPMSVTVSDPEGKQLAAVIVGTQRYGPPAQVFVRRVGETQSWLAEATAGQVSLPRDVMGWIDRQVVAIPRSRVRSVMVTQPDGESVFVGRASEAETNFTVSGVPDGRELTSPTAGDQFGNWIASVYVDDVAPVDRADLTEAGGAEPGATATFTTFDGLVVVAEAMMSGVQTWVRFEASVDESVRPAAPAEGEEAAAGSGLKSIEEVRQEAEDLNKKFAGWAFQIPDYKATTLRTRMGGLLKPLPEPAPEATPEPASAEQAGTEPAVDAAPAAEPAPETEPVPEPEPAPESGEPE